MPDDPSIEEELRRFETADASIFETDNAQMSLDQEDLHYDEDIEILDESYRDVVKEGAIITNPTNDPPNNDCENIDSNEMVEDEVPIVVPSADYNLDLNPNSQMSCYIDSFMELLWHSVLPHVDIEKIALESKHPTDNALLHTFELMKMGRRRDASNEIRRFVYTSIKQLYQEGQDLYKQGVMYDVVDFVMDFAEQASRQLYLTFTHQPIRYNMCHKDIEHCWFLSQHSGHYNVPFLSLISRQTVNNYKLSVSSVHFEEAVSNMILHPQTSKQCLYCEDMASQSNLPTTNPPFIFFADKLSSESTCSDNIIFPYNMKLFSQNYQMHAVIESTSRQGIHFKTTAIINSNGGCFLACLDNLRRPGIEIITKFHLY